jgi:hypothetical protein
MSKIVLVETVSTFRHVYAIELEDNERRTVCQMLCCFWLCISDLNSDGYVWIMGEQ